MAKTLTGSYSRSADEALAEHIDEPSVARKGRIAARAKPADAKAPGASSTPTQLPAAWTGPPRWARTLSRCRPARTGHPRGRTSSDASKSQSMHADHHAGLHAALRSTAADGICTSVAIYFEPSTPVPLLEMYTRGCTLHTGRCHARALIPEVLALVADGRLDPALVPSAVVGFDDAESALTELPTKLILAR